MYSSRIELALTTTLESHGLRQRKAGRGYELAHVCSVAMIAHDFGFDEDTVIAALLHDTLEDTDIDPARIAERFGRLVLDIVRDVTEPPKPRAWRERKTAYIDQLRRTPRPGARAVASADKIHNLTNMTQGLEHQGAPFFRPFTSSLADMCWYQQEVMSALRTGWSHRILDEHQRRLDRFLGAANVVGTGQG